MPKLGGTTYSGFQVVFDLRPSWWPKRHESIERLGRAFAAIRAAVDWGPSEVVLRDDDLILTIPIPRGDCSATGLYRLRARLIKIVEEA